MAANLINKIDDIYLSDNAILWLSDILSDRFGQNVKITLNDNSSYKLTIDNCQISIIIDSLVSDFSRPQAKVGFSYWNSEIEGFSSVLNLPIPAPGYNVLTFPLVQKSDNNIFLHYDLLGLIYWCLTRVEEYNDVELDTHGRYPVDQSHAKIHNYLDRPIVDEWIEILKQIILQNCSNITFKKNSFSLILSHDVDRPFLYLNLSIIQLCKIVTKEIFNKLNIFNSVKRFYHWYLVKYQKKYIFDPYYTFDFIMDSASVRGLNCTFYFLSGNTNKFYDADYKIDDYFMVRLLRKVKKNGHSIGIHPSYNSFYDPKIIKNEILTLVSTCHSNDIDITSIESRMHYLRFNIKNTINYLSQNFVFRDSSLNYANESGFRCGTCYDYVFFDHGTQNKLNILQRPLIVMDNNFIHKVNKQNLEIELKKIKVLKERCMEVSGNFTVLWHNSELYTDDLKKIFLDCIS